MDTEYCQYLCRSMAKATGLGVRLYRDREFLYYYSVYHIHPDPAAPFLESILDSAHKAGIFVTPLYQLIGYLTLPENVLVVIGPSRCMNQSERLMEELLFLLEVPSEEKEEYTRLLRCLPHVTPERMSWMLSYMMSSEIGEIFPVEDVYIHTEMKDYYHEVQTDSVYHTLSAEADAIGQVLDEDGYSMEQLLFSYVKAGQPEKLEELFSAAPSIAEGNMAQDSLRQKKNAGICAAAVVSRTAIAGGMDSQAAFRLSDLYIQKFELIRDISSTEKLILEMIIDYARRVQQIKFNTQKESVLFQKCAAYVSQHIYENIRVDNLAASLGYSRSYLCNQFKKQTGISITQYVLHEKIIETQRMLQFTDKSLSEIAAQLSFSSQSHFQTVFKKMTGQTPLLFRQNITKNYVQKL